MVFEPKLVEELEILNRYSLATTQEGIKVHKAAGSAAIAATERLFEKGLVTHVDGGYLTPLGIEAVTHLRQMLTILTSA